MIVTLARKPLSPGENIASNVAKFGGGALNIDASRVLQGVQPSETTAPGWDSVNKTNARLGYRPVEYHQGDATYLPSTLGRWPANLLLTCAEAITDLDLQSGESKSPDSGGGACRYFWQAVQNPQAESYTVHQPENPDHVQEPHPPAA